MKWTLLLTKKVGVLKKVFLAAAVVIIAGCAEIAPPPGGEVDKRSPSILAASPENGAVNVPFGNSVLIRFSERIQKPAKGRKALFISPRQETEPQINWKSDHVSIIFADSFSADQTYIISLGSEIKDLRNNGIDSGSVIAFSTGDSIASGTLVGNVYLDDNPQNGFLVGLYTSNMFIDNYLNDSTFPMYIAQTNRDGLFSFRYLPKDDFKLIAFKDINHNEIFEPDKEMFALPDRALDWDRDYVVDKMALFATMQDTLAPEISSAMLNKDNLLRVNFNNAIPTDYMIQHPESVNLISLSDSVTTYIAKAVFNSDEDESSEALIWFESIPDGDYTLKVAYDSDLDPMILEKFTLEKHKDENKPQIKSTSLKTISYFYDELKLELYFSEPIDTTKLSETTFTLWEDDSTYVPLTASVENSLSATFNKDQIIQGNNYRLKISAFEIFDLAGNSMGDSLNEYSFRTYNPDSLGLIRGSVENQMPGKETGGIYLSFSLLGTNQVFDMKVDDKAFSIDLPPGKYIISGFIDENGNEKLDLGTAMPYSFSETILKHPDTIAVRSRFETSGINFRFK